METAKFDIKKYDPSKKEPGVIQGLITGVDNLISSSEENKTDISNVSQPDPTEGQVPEDKKGSGSVSRFNQIIRNLGDDLKGFAKDEGTKLASNAIAGAAQNQTFQMQPAFKGNVISSSQENKEDAPEVDKEMVEENGGVIPMMAKIDSYLYQYKPEAQEEYAGTGMMNDDTNLGVIAEQMNENPLTKPAVTKDQEGKLALDGGRLASINTAVISELCRKVMELEAAIYGRK